MSLYSLPKFQEHIRGVCDICRDVDVPLYVFPGYVSVCKFCLENEMDVCCKCGSVWCSDAIDWEECDDGLICEDCAAEMEDEE